MKIVYNSYNGRYADSPRAVHEALLRRDGDRHEHVWMRDRTLDGGFPTGVATCEISAPDAIDALESADLVISDSHIELEWSKRSGATYVQTWHGTPLKRVHTDVLTSPDGLLERLSRDVDRWDVLLSPNHHSTVALQGAFSWRGRVLEIGYPRNDVLLGPDAGRIRTQVRRSLGIADRQTAVLYTPTFRDDVLWGQGPDAAARALDLPDLDGLGDGYAVLLRLHYKLTGSPRLAGSTAVRDVSRHPDVAELYLAADAMVTDYSSTMFDFAVTGKPLLFYTYDLERYRDEVRGFYFDLAADPPGPLVRTPPELVERLRHLDPIRNEYAGAYARFRQRYCHLDDGRATERFLEHLVPPA